MKIRLNVQKTVVFLRKQPFFMVRVARLELAASWSQTRRPTSWATPGYLLLGKTSEGHSIPPRAKSQREFLLRIWQLYTTFSQNAICNFLFPLKKRRTCNKCPLWIAAVWQSVTCPENFIFLKEPIRSLLQMGFPIVPVLITLQNRDLSFSF